MRHKLFRSGTRAAVLLMTLALPACSGRPASAPIVLPVLVRSVVKLHALPTPTTEVMIPAAAFVLRGGIPGVFVLRHGLARFRMVRVGKNIDGQLQILSGLSGDETLVIGDLADVHDGSPITVSRP